MEKDKLEKTHKRRLSKDISSSLLKSKLKQVRTETKYLGNYNAGRELCRTESSCSWSHSNCRRERRIMSSKFIRSQNIDKPGYFQCCCCCNLPVRTGALVIAILHILSSLSKFFFLYPDSFVGIFYGILFVTSVLIIYADRREKAWAYIPYIMFEIIIIVFGFVYIILLVEELVQCIVFFLNNTITDEHTRSYQPVRNKPTLAEIEKNKNDCIDKMVLFIVFAVIMLFEIWFCRIVFKAYIYMREVVCATVIGEQ